MRRVPGTNTCIGTGVQRLGAAGDRVGDVQPVAVRAAALEMLLERSGGDRPGETMWLRAEVAERRRAL